VQYVETTKSEAVVSPDQTAGWGVQATLYRALTT
jgi:hypothetical protein